MEKLPDEQSAFFGCYSVLLGRSDQAVRDGQDILQGRVRSEMHVQI